MIDGGTIADRMGAKVKKKKKLEEKISARTGAERWPIDK